MALSGCARFVYNQTLAVCRDAYAAGNPLRGYDCVKLLPGLKGTYSWLKEVRDEAGRIIGCRGLARAM